MVATMPDAENIHMLTLHEGLITSMQLGDYAAAFAHQRGPEREGRKLKIVFAIPAYCLLQNILLDILLA